MPTTRKTTATTRQPAVSPGPAKPVEFSHLETVSPTETEAVSVRPTTTPFAP